MGLTIKEAIQQIIKNDEELYSIVATVTSVDEDKRTVDVAPIDGSADIYDVKLQANESAETGIVSIPSQDSEVVVTFFSKDTAFISLCTDVDKLLIDTDEITINGGDNGGLINIKTLVDKLNNLESDLNELKITLNTWVPIPTDGGASLKTVLTSYIAAALVPTLKIDIEDDKITH